MPDKQRAGSIMEYIEHTDAIEKKPADNEWYEKKLSAQDQAFLNSELWL